MSFVLDQTAALPLEEPIRFVSENGAADGFRPANDDRRYAKAAFGERLKRATDPSHRRLDADFVDIGQDIAIYRRFLAMSHAAHHRLEPLVEAAAAHDSVLASYRPLRRHLDRDMDALSIAPLRHAVTARFGSDAASAAGILYVLEGSRLGARMIARTIAASPLRQSGVPVSTVFLEAASERFDFRDRLRRLGEALLFDQDQSQDPWRRAEDAARAAFDIYLQCSAGGEAHAAPGAGVVSEEA